MKFDITPELSLLIKTLRTQNNIPSKALAKSIGRSPSYLTKVESGKVKMIKAEVLYALFDGLCQGDQFYPDKFNTVVKVLSQIAEPERFFQQKWMLQMDVFDRPVTMPLEMAADVVKRLDTLGYSITDLADIMNSNRDLYGAAELPVNEIVMVESGEGSIFRIRFFIRPEKLENLLEQRDLKTNYETCYNIGFTLAKLEKFGNVGHIEPEKAREVLAEVDAYLASYELYSMSRYGHVLASSEFQSKQRLLLDTFNTASSRSVNGIIDMFNQVAEIDKVTAARSIDRMRDNMEWDPAFMLNLIAIPFSELKEMSYSNRKEMLAELRSVYETFLNMPEGEKKLEKY